jgi:hypothetical protein
MDSKKFVVEVDLARPHMQTLGAIGKLLCTIGERLEMHGIENVLELEKRDGVRFAIEARISSTAEDDNGPINVRATTVAETFDTEQQITRVAMKEEDSVILPTRVKRDEVLP